MSPATTALAVCAAAAVEELPHRGVPNVPVVAEPADVAQKEPPCQVC